MKEVKENETNAGRRIYAETRYKAIDMTDFFIDYTCNGFSTSSTVLMIFKDIVINDFSFSSIEQIASDYGLDYDIPPLEDYDEYNNPDGSKKFFICNLQK